MPEGVVLFLPLAKPGAPVPVAWAVTRAAVGTGPRIEFGVQPGTRICVPLGKSEMMQLYVHTASPADFEVS